MAEFQKVMEERQRMCNSYESCCQCRIHSVNDICQVWISKKPKEAEQIIMEWSAEHPIKTNAMKFKEVFGFEFTDRVPESQYHREWLDAEYKGGQG